MTDHSDLIERLQDRAASYRIGGPSSEHTALLLDQAAIALSSQSLSTENAALPSGVQSEIAGPVATSLSEARAAPEILPGCQDCATALSEAREEIERLKGLVAGIRECPQEPWQDIATAPKDGTEILLYGHGVLRSGGVYAKGRHVGWSQLARDGSTYWATRDPAVDCEPTHWMRLPKPPSALENSK